MAPSCPTGDILTHQHRFADRVAGIGNTDDLAGLVDEINDWLQETKVSNCVSPNVLGGFWTERLKSHPFIVSDIEKKALADEIRAWYF